jgi:hypothetical protein
MTTALDIAAEALPDTDESVPCEFLRGGEPCGDPAAWRVRLCCYCINHLGTTRTAFACTTCYVALRAGSVVCEFWQAGVTWLGEL